jgi:D-amino-acid dehydrogenase
MRMSQRSRRGRVVIVGAGIVAVAAAIALLDDGWEILLLAPDPIGKGGAAIGSAGLLATQTVQPLAMPGLAARIPRMLTDPDAPLSIRWAYAGRLLPWLVRALAASRRNQVERLSLALADLLRDAIDAYGPILAAASAAALVRRDGLVMVHRNDEQLAAANAEIELRRRRGVRLELVSGDRLRALAPALSPEYRHGVFYPDCGHVADPQALVCTLGQAALSRGARFAREAVVGFDLRRGAAAAVRTTTSAHPADAVVIAAGAWSGEIVRLLGLRVPLEHERGYHVTLPEPDIELRLPIIVGDVRFAVTPLAIGLRLAGTIEFAGLRAPPNPSRYEMLLRHAKACLPGLNSSRATRWMGFRPSLPDSLPVIGRSPSHHNVYFAFGHGHLGVTMAAVTARMVADLAAGRAPPIEVTPFRIDRFH